MLELSGCEKAPLLYLPLFWVVHKETAQFGQPRGGGGVWRGEQDTLDSVKVTLRQDVSELTSRPRSPGLLSRTQSLAMEKPGPTEKERGSGD